MSLDTAPSAPAPATAGPATTGIPTARTPTAPRHEATPATTAVEAADPARSLLAGYPHVARCPTCLGYTRDHLGEVSGIDLLIATLARHDTGHRLDPLSASSQHFRPLP